LSTEHILQNDQNRGEFEWIPGIESSEDFEDAITVSFGDEERHRERSNAFVVVQISESKATEFGYDGPLEPHRHISLCSGLEIDEIDAIESPRRWSSKEVFTEYHRHSDHGKDL